MANWTGAKFGYYVAISCLVIGLTVAAALVAVGFHGGGAQPKVEISGVHAQACPTGERAPACFSVAIRNLGSDFASVTCAVTPAEGTTASFVTTEDAETVRVIGPGSSTNVEVKVDTAGSDTASAPNIDCHQT